MYSLNLLQVSGIDSMTWLVFSILGFGISIAIAYSIIEGATKSKKIVSLQSMQMEILKEIAIKNGVDPERIDTIVKKHTKKK